MVATIPGFKNKVNLEAPQDVLNVYRESLKKDATVLEIMKRTSCTPDHAVNCIFQLAHRGVVTLLMQPNNEVLVDLVPDEETITDIIVESEIRRITKGADKGVI